MILEENKNKVVTAFGELLMRMHCKHNKRFEQVNEFEVSYSGAEANVAVLLARLGIPSRFITRLPVNDIARSALDNLRRNNVDTNSILHGGDRMGIYFTEEGNMLRPSQVIYDRQYSSFASVNTGTYDWNKIFSDTAWFHWSGICPALSQGVADVCKEALLMAKQKQITVSADFNYRSKLWKYGVHPSAIMPELLSYCDVITGDIDTAKIYFGIEPIATTDHEESFMHCAKSLQEKLPYMKTFAMSFRGTNAHHQLMYRGALMHEGKYFYSTSYLIPQVVDRLGTGDAFNAGLIYSLHQHAEPQQVIDFATACGVLKHSVSGDFAILSKEEIIQFIQTGPNSRVIR